MHKMILLLFAGWFSMGAYLIGAELLRIPTYKATKAILGTVRRSRKQAHSTEAVLMELAERLANILPMDDYKKRRLTAILKSAGLPMTAEVYLSLSIVKAGLIFAGVIPCLLILPLAAPVILILGIAVYFKESSRAEQMVIKRRNEIEYELPRFAATLSQQLKASRDVLSILESYQKNAGVTFREELVITIADMRTGNYEGALTRLEGRVSSAMLSDVVRGLIGVLRGDDGIAFFVMLSHDMKQLEVQRLKKQALERPPKIRRYSFLLLAAMVLLYMGVIGYQILGTMSGLL